MLKDCFSLPKLYVFRTSTCFNHPVLLEKFDKTVSDGLSKVCSVNFDNSRGQLSLPAKLCGLGVSAADFPSFWPLLLVRVTFSRRFSRKHSQMFFYKSA